jgi:ABC-type Fe3+/spermidine/putrescine transport system ATPase subunit
MQPWLEVKQLSLNWHNTNAVQEISFSVPAHQRLAIAGETGSGKSSLLQMMGGLLQPTGGETIFDGERVKGPDEQLLPGHKGIAYLSQHFELRHHYKVHELLSYANQWNEKESQRLYALCRIENFLHRRSEDLSGGEKQRVALAKLLTTKPRLLLLDEPFSNLDRTHKQIMQEVLADMEKELGISCLMASHETDDLLGWASRVIIMRDGKLVQDADPETLYHRPANAYCAALTGEYDLLDPEWFGLNTHAGQKLFCRPAYWQITFKGASQLEGKVIKRIFLGAYDLLTVLVRNIPVQVMAPTGKVAEGDAVFITRSLENAWFL